MSEVLTPSSIVLLILGMTMDETDLDTVFADAGVPPERLFDHDMMSSRDVLALAQSAIRLSNDPALGLHLGQEIGVEMLDLIGMLVSSAPTAGQALESLTQYLPLLSTLGRVELVETADRARLVLHLVDDMLSIETPYVTELACAAFVCIARRLVDGEVRLRRLRSRHAEPPWAAEYAQVFGEEVEIVFSAGEDSLEFDRRLLELPMARHSPGLYQYLRAQAARRLACRPQPETTAGSVQRLIREQLGRRLVDLPTIAEAMGLTPRTLQRRLSEEGSSFQLLYEQCRRQHAHEALAASEVDIDLLAASLGYSEPSNFYRAFRGWFGLTPAEYRRRHGPG